MSDKIEFRCWSESEGSPENGGTVFAHDACDAAEEYAETYFNGYAESPKDLDVFVRDPQGVVEHWWVEAEYTVNFNAYFVKPKSEQPPASAQGRDA
jgi:hypothetical protein